VVARDGRLDLCVYQADDGTFAWRVQSEAGSGAAGFDSRLDAKVAAWRALASRNVGPLVSGVSTRHGLTAYPSGRLDATDAVAWGRYAFPVLRSELDHGERDPWGLALSALLAAFPQVNPFRWKPRDGALDQAVARLGAVLVQERSLLTEDRMALALFGSTFGNAFALRGRLAELRAVQSNTGTTWQFRIDGGAWTAGGATRGDAMVAAATAAEGVQQAGFSVGGA